MEKTTEKKSTTTLSKEEKQEEVSSLEKKLLDLGFTERDKKPADDEIVEMTIIFRP